ncbi:F/Y rich C-terminus-domain-containing protein [Panaeolus papilionaceus]|nr:F/Y rich C-terminus-domain-containing protein [Panaeolus papilionaceus]
MSLAKMGALTPTHLMMPYPLFYPHPGTPVTPNTPSYPMPYNPYYYLASPLMASPGGVYPSIPPTTAAAASSSSSSASASASTSQPRPAAAPAAAEQPPKPKAKRTKTHAVTSKSFSIPVVPRDKNRNPMLPLNVGIMTVINLGVVCMREHFHSERYIFPVGYEVTRRYLSTVDPAAEVVYHCTILDGGDGPKFQIVPSDRPDKPVIAGTATGAWSSIVKQANHIRNRQHSNSVSGPDFFGLGQNTIKHLIQELPNADRLRDYVWQNFMEGGPLGGRHAAVIPALPEEYDSSLPLGAYYPKRDPSNPNVPRGMAHYPSHIIAQAEAERGHKYVAGSLGTNGATPQHSVASGSGSSTPQPQSMQMQIQMQVQPTPPESLQQQNGGQPPLQIIPQNPGGPPTLNIQEYHPPQQQQQVQEAISAPSGLPRQYTPERRTKATNGSISAPVPPPAATTPGRATRSSTRGAQKQTQQAVTQQQQVQAQLQAHLLQQQQQHGIQEGMPTTLAGVMQMYPTLSGVNMPSGTNS